MTELRLATLEERVLVLMPSTRDAERSAQLLNENNLFCTVCAGLSELCTELRAGAAALLLTDEIISGDRDRQLAAALRDQRAWSALPVLVLAREGAPQRAASGALDAYRSVVLVERPVRTRSLISVIDSALRARRDQYEIRDAILERERQSLELLAQDERLRTADRLKDEFLATLAHELRNPLAPIRTGLNLLSDSSDPELTRKTLGMMQRQVGHMVRLIDDLLDVSRITRGKLELRRERITLASVLDAAIEGSLPNLQRGQHTLRTDLTDEPLSLDADHTRVAQVISNLLNNSSKYTPNGGIIELSAQREGDFVRIAVRDNGVGIPSDRLEDVFQMFSQVNRALEHSQGGLGIGLALVRKLVEMHAGTVTAESPGPDLGSTFTIRLPLAASAAAPRERLSVPAAMPGAGRILVVDDNDDAAELLALSLQQAGYETATAHDGSTAIEAAVALKPHVVILDIGLPDINGYQVAEQLRKDPSLSHTALVALTGWGTPEDQRRALAAGFDVHLTKPVAAGDLREAMGRATGLRSRCSARGL
jgi:signal transduction histidine kinase/ActR/RegA family two-component response regulator